MRKIFFINSLLEGLSGLVIMFKPELLLMSDSLSNDGLIVSRLYGILAMVFGLVSYQLFKYYEENQMFKMLALIISFFHMAVCFHLYGAYQTGVTTHIGSTALHGVVALVFLLLYMNNIKAAETE